MEPVTSISPARNNWYLVQAMLSDVMTRLKPVRTTTRLGIIQGGIYTLTSSACKRHMTAQSQLTAAFTVIGKNNDGKEEEVGFFGVYLKIYKKKLSGHLL